MASNDYHFITNWRVQGTREEVADILFEATDLARWWPSVYLGVERLKEGGPDGVGRVIALYTKGLLPYTLRWQFEVVEAEYPGTMTISASGDFVGQGKWTFTQDGPYVNVKYDWRIKAEKPLLRKLSSLIKPIFAANHHWAMNKGEESLKLELERRRAKTPKNWRQFPRLPARPRQQARPSGLPWPGR